VILLYYSYERSFTLVIAALKTGIVKLAIDDATAALFGMVGILRTHVSVSVGWLFLSDAAKRALAFVQSSLP
jgi:hypothetical protein